MGDQVLESWSEGGQTLTMPRKAGGEAQVEELDMLITRHQDSGMYAISIINKNPAESRAVTLPFADKDYRILTVNGDSTESYNDVDITGVTLTEGPWQSAKGSISIEVAPHSVNVVQIKP